MTRPVLSCAVVLLAASVPVDSFVVGPRLKAGFASSKATRETTLQHPREDGTTSTSLSVTRRSFVENLPIVAIAAGSVGFSGLPEAWASGGATAGGAYLLSAKQRYNERITKGVSGLVGLRSSLERGDLDPLRAYFTSEEVGGWKDFSAAGYLLANAFRTSSSTAPDKLPSVKKWKAFAAEVETMTKSLKKKDTKGALVAYDGAIAALDEYLAKVELPSAKEIK